MKSALLLCGVITMSLSNLYAQDRCPLEGKKRIHTVKYSCHAKKKNQSISAIQLETKQVETFLSTQWRNDPSCISNLSDLEGVIKISGMFEGQKLDTGSSKFILREEGENGIHTWDPASYSVGGKVFYFDLSLEFSDGDDHEYMSETEATIGLSKNIDDVPDTRNDSRLPVFKCVSKYSQVTRSLRK